MNLDANLQKIISLMLGKWKLIVSFAVLGAIVAYICTYMFVSPVYSSSVEFLTYAQDSSQEISDSSSQTTASDAVRNTTSNTSRMNYAMKMIYTYVEVLKTTEFNAQVAQALNRTYGTNYSAGFIKAVSSIQLIEETAMFRIVVTTEDAELSYKIARQMEESVPERVEKTNNGLIKASVEDPALKSSSSGSHGYKKKCAIGAAVGVVLIAAYIILRDLLDVRIKRGDNLQERYSIPVLGAIPDFGKMRPPSSDANKAKGAK